MLDVRCYMFNVRVCVCCPEQFDHHVKIINTYMFIPPPPYTRLFIVVIISL